MKSNLLVKVLLVVGLVLAVMTLLNSLFTKPTVSRTVTPITIVEPPKREYTVLGTYAPSNQPQVVFELVTAPSYGKAVCLSEVQGFPGYIYNPASGFNITLVFEGNNITVVDLGEINLATTLYTDYEGIEVITATFEGLQFPQELILIKKTDGVYDGSMAVSVTTCP